MDAKQGIKVVTNSGETVFVNETLFDKAQCMTKVAAFVRDHGSLTTQESTELATMQEAVQGPMVFVKQGSLLIGMMEVPTVEPKIVQCIYVLGDRNVYMLKASVVVKCSRVGRVDAKVMGEMSVTNGKPPERRAA